MKFEEKKEVFNSFQDLKERSISYSRINYEYPASVQRGKILARELHPSGNGYVLGKYMSADVVKSNGYSVDSRGWISISNFTREELINVINNAMMSMSGKATKS
ncbi:hypothetical protein [Mesobacillus jeotgali]|uniref:hypothetical protein n=1 Tax=Mesobacillus jeotgali TaxID=129985 RepID=UPI00177AD043|nr:hypothetical protein [Mesobacillus jeotgali]UYZ21733.1 hypothetical protein FOF60_22505 [Mesobacillus jeotgali]